MLKVSSIKNLNESYATAWENLLSQIEIPLASQGYDWIKSWWEAFAPRDSSLFVLLANKGDELVGIAPLMYKKNLFAKHISLKFIGAGFFDYFDFILKKGVEAQIIDSFIEYTGSKFKNFEIQLNNLLPDSCVFGILAKKKYRKLSSGFSYICETDPYLSLPQKKEEFPLSLSNSLNYDLRRKGKKLNILGEVEFNGCQGLTQAESALEDFFALHIKKWEADYGYSVYKFPRWRKFTRSLLHRLFIKGCVNLYSLSVNGKKIALCFAFRMRTRLLYYHFSHDPDYARYSPGKLLLAKLINQAIEEGFREFDFGIGKEAYKLKWPCRIRRLSDLYFFQAGNLFWLFYLKFRRYGACVYYFKLLPRLRKLRPFVLLWRWGRRKTGSYKRFQ